MTQLGRKVNPEVGYEYDAFQLNGGLNFIDSKISVAKGSLINCLNREVIDRIGYKRIDGFEPYNGGTSPYQADYYYVDSVSSVTQFPISYAIGAGLMVDGVDEPFGVAVDNISFDSPTPGEYITRLFFTRMREEFEPSAGDTVVPTAGSGSGSIVLSTGVMSCIEDLGETAEETVVRFNGYADYLRNLTEAYEPLPEHAIGLHWYRDQLYSVVDESSFYFDAGTTEVFANQFIGTGAAGGRIVSVVLNSGTWGGGDAQGIIQYESLFGGFSNNTSLNIYPNDSFVTPTTSNVLVVATEADVTDATQPQYATLYRANDELQQEAIVGSFAGGGWQRIDQGWKADFTDGLSDSLDGLTIVSRGSDNNFDFVEADEDTFPYAIFNGTNSVGTPFSPSTVRAFTSETVELGYPGWKTNASKTVFAGSDALKTATDTNDANYAYANIWYYAATAPDNGGYASGALTSSDKSIYGPVSFASSFSGASAPVTIGSETFTTDSDWFTTQARAPLILNNFGVVASDIPDGSLISGVEVIVEYDSMNYAEGQFTADRNGTAGADIVANNITFIENNLSFGCQFIESTTSTEGEAQGEVQYAPVEVPTTGYQSTITFPSAAADVFRMVGSLATQTTTIGASDNTFGVNNMTKNDLFNPALGIALFGQVTASPLYPLTPPMEVAGLAGTEFVHGQLRLKIDKITVRFHYVTPSARYYVGDGAGNTASIDLVYQVRASGDWSVGTAAGSLQFTNLTPVTNTTLDKRTVESTNTLHATDAAAVAGTDAVATFSTDMDYNGLPSLNRIVEKGSRYEFITANFFGREDWDGFYGVSGAGPAFSFATYDADDDGDNEDYLVNIITNTEDPADDIPRHIAYHHNALALGYNSGVVRFSQLGEPEKFDGALGAAEIGVGDSVTGLLSMKGTTLGVFCENSVWGILGTDVDNYQTQVLAAYTGALEYTVVDMGIPVYCDSRGISTLEQTEKYGDFLGLRMSAPITPWITPRMLRNTAQFLGTGVVCAIPIRAKNQYRLFFKDGKVLVMTVNPDQAPSFTFSEYYGFESNPDYYMVPFAWSSQVDDNGVERIHISHYAPKSSFDSNLVYELDRGWGFAGEYIPANYVTNWFYKDPFNLVTAKKLRLDGLTNGLSQCNVTLAKEYESTFSTASVDISLDLEADSPYYPFFQPTTTMANIAVRGRSIAFKITDTESDLGPIPPDVHQTLLIQFDSGGKVDS